MDVLKIIGLYLIQPVVLLGSAWAYILYRKRIKSERYFFRTAIDRDSYEVRHFVKNSCLLGLVFSLITFGIGFYLPIKAVILYEIFAVIAILLSQYVSLGFSAIIMSAFLSYVGLNFRIDYLPKNNLGIQFLVITLMYILAKIYIIQRSKSEWFSPRIINGKRGRKIVYYIFKEISVIPLVIIIPGDLFTTTLKFWPTFNVSGKSFGVFIFPLFISLGLKVFKLSIKNALKIYQKQLKILFLISFVVTICSYFFKEFSYLGILFIGVISFGFYLKRKKLDNLSDRWYVETTKGVRVIATQPKTPARKMGLENGDVIIECNGVLVNSEKELYAAIQKDAAYCHLKVKSFDGDVKVTESAIYSDSPHEIGIILFR